MSLPRNRLFIRMLCLSIFAIALIGCRAFKDVPLANPGGQAEIPNPLPVAATDRWLVMDQVSDELDNYFRIYREERIRLVDNILTEGWIETHPKIGATLLEPWHEDSTRGFERLHASLQSVRRFAKVRVIPAGNGYQVDVKVYKELEDLPEPQNSTVSGRSMWHDSSLDIDLPYENVGPVVNPKNSGWIPMGRDFSLEQKILMNIQGRLSQIANVPDQPQNFQF